MDPEFGNKVLKLFESHFRGIRHEQVKGLIALCQPYQTQVNGLLGTIEDSIEAQSFNLKSKSANAMNQEITPELLIGKVESDLKDHTFKDLSLYSNSVGTVAQILGKSITVAQQ